LYKLIHKGIVGYVIKENRRYFSAADPEKLLDVLKEKEEAVKELIPQLRSFKTSVKQEPTIEVYKGIEGLKTSLNDILDEGKDYYIIGYTGEAAKRTKHWFPHWTRRRIRAKLRRHILFPHNFREKKETLLPLTRKRFLPKGYVTPVSTFMYGRDKVLIFLPTKEDFTGIIIKSKEVWEAYRNTFDILWNISKK
jgi:sugar-specific transcriptional regulator TrmB